MYPTRIRLNEPVAARRRVPIWLVDATDGLTAETAVAGKPEFSLVGAAPVGTTNNIVQISAANMPGLYYIELDATEVVTVGTSFLSFKTAATAQWHGSFEVWDPNESTGAVSGSSSISVSAISRTLTSGTETGTFADTAQRDGVYHVIDDTAGGLIEIYYEFNVGGNGVPVSVTHYGRVNSANDPIGVFAYNWTTLGWEQVGTLTGTNTTSDTERTFSLLLQHVGFGPNIGVVRVQFEAAGLTTAFLRTDQLYVSYAVVAESVGYADGAVWVDTINGTAGQVAFVNGVADNPCLTWADALAVAAAIGLQRFQIVNGSTIALTANSDNFTIIGQEWELDLQGQSIANAYIEGATVTGISTGLHSQMRNCVLGTTLFAVSFWPGSSINCGFGGTIVIAGAGTHYFDGCYSGVAGTATPVINVGAAVGNTNLNIRHYSGGIEFQNLGVLGTDNVSLEGFGQFIIAASCVGGTIACRGHFDKTDLAGGLVTVVDDPRFDSADLVDAIWDEDVINAHQVANTAGKLLSDAWRLFSSWISGVRSSI